MIKTKSSALLLAFFTLFMALDAPAQNAASLPANSGPIPEIIVTVQKRAQSAQSVPDAISAFTAEDLEAARIDDATALHLNIPNMYFSRAGFGSNNYAIRGVGIQTTSSGADSGITIHMNGAPIGTDRSSDVDFLDVERVEVLRGPQGTQFGRSATGGVINIVTRKPEDYLNGSLSVGYGSFNLAKLKGHFNVPLSDSFALRVAAEYYDRDGDVENLETSNDIDARKIILGRGTLAFTPSDDLSATLMWQHFDEDDSRNDRARTLCQNDPGPQSIGGVPVNDLTMRNYLSQGCKPADIYGNTVYGLSNSMAGLSGAFGSRFGLIDGSVDGNASVVQSRDLREVRSVFDPVYKVENDVVQLNIEWSPVEWLTVTSLTGWSKDEQSNFFDTNHWIQGQGLVADRTNGIGTNVTPGGFIDDPQIGTFDRVVTAQLWGFSDEQWSEELRFQSDFDGPVNFAVGAIYSNDEKLNNFNTLTNSLTALSQFLSNATTVIPVDTRSRPDPLDPYNLGHNYTSFIRPFELDSKAFFGEVYWDVQDNLRFTTGVRYTDDEKTFTIFPSTFLARVPVALDYGSPEYTAYPCDTAVYDASQIRCPFENTGKYDAWTGKASLDWSPDLSFTDETLLYLTLARGYKPGGFNPATLAGDPITSFDPELIDSVEIGMKNTLFGNSLILNFGAFHYNYKGYQIGVLTSAASLTSNINADVNGFESSVIWNVTDAFRVNASVGILDTSLKSGPNDHQVDLADPTAGDPDWSVVKTSNGQCIVPTDILAAIIAKQNAGAGPNYTPSRIRFGFAGDATNPSGLCNSVGVPGYAYGADGLDSTNVIQNGREVSLVGNQLPSAPELTYNIGFQYSWDIGQWRSTLRSDLHYQGESYTRLFNKSTDRIEDYINLNMTLSFERSDGWSVQLYGKNITDSDQITGFGLASITFGETSSVRTLEPRMFGIEVAKSFAP